MITPSLVNLLLGTPIAPAGGNPDRQVAQATVIATVATKVYPNKAPESPKVLPPYITLRQVSGTHVMALSGPEGTAAVTVHIVAHHLTGNDADALADNIRKFLNGYSTPSWQSVTPRIKAMFLDDDSEDWDADIYGSEIGRHVVPMTFKVWHTE